MELLIAPYSDLYQAGVTADGEIYTAERFGVLAEASDGRRWAHNHTFRGVNLDYCEETGEPIFNDVSAKASECADRLAARIAAHVEAGGTLDFHNWHEVDPVYGSPAFQALDNAGWFKAREKDEEDARHFA